MLILCHLAAWAFLHLKSPEGIVGHLSTCCSNEPGECAVRSRFTFVSLATKYTVYSFPRCTAVILDFPATYLRTCLLVSAVVCDASWLIMFPVSAGSRPATGHADVVVDNWTPSTVEDYECVVILSRWRPALGDYCTLHLRKERREGEAWQSDVLSRCLSR